MSQPVDRKPAGLEVNTAKEVVGRPLSGHQRRASLSPSFSTMTIPSVSPEPVYIAPAAASNIATSEVVTQFNLPIYDDDDAASVAPSALVLINSFLDRLLFSFLSSSHSTSLASLRPAVVEVLKPKLAKEAIQSADEELQEYIGGDEDELDAFHNGQDQPHRWDLDLIWRRTRLRCMVYTRLGDMEEDDEEMYIEQDNLDDGEDETGRITREIGIVSPAVAIFLTSILEFVGEHALMIAAHAAYRRYELRARMESKPIGDGQGIIIEDIDMEKVAFNPIMGRLWRSWRKSIRSPRDSRGGRSFSGSRRSSLATNDLPEEELPSVASVLEEPEPWRVPLPMNDHDVDEIEVPGFIASRTSDRGENQRPRSAVVPGDWMDKISHEDVIDQESPDLLPRRLSHDFALVFPIPFVYSDDEEDEEEEESAAEDYKTPDEDSQDKEVEKDMAMPLPSKAAGVITTATRAEANRVVAAGSRAIGKQSNELYSPPISPLELRDRRRDSRVPSEGDPAADALQFDSTDYQVLEHERIKRMSAVPEPSVQPPSAKGSYPNHETSFFRDANDRYSIADQPDEHATTRMEAHRISPVDRKLSIASGEVSPMEPGDYEEDARSKLKPLDLRNEPVTPPMVSPLEQPSPPRMRKPSQPTQPTQTSQHSQPPQSTQTNEGSIKAQRVFVEPRRQAQAVAVQPAPPPLKKDSSLTKVPQSRSASNEVVVKSVVPKEVEVKPATPPKEVSPQKMPSPIKDTAQASPRSRQRRTEGPTEADYAKEQKREAFVVAEEPTSTRPESASSTISAQDLQPDGTIRKKGHDLGGSTSNLAPLREENVPNASDSYNVDQQSASREIPQTTGMQKPSERRQVTPVQSQPGVDKAAVQRVSSAQSRESYAQPARASVAESRGSRTLSTRSKRVTSNSSDPRGSVASGSSIERQTSTIDDKSHADRQSDFEQLITSGETIQYTLTPQNMRDIESRKSGVASQVSPPLSPPVITTPKAPNARGVQTSPVVERSQGLRPRTMVTPAASVVPQGQSASNGPAFNIYSGPVPKRGPQQQPREARTSRDTASTRDFADFIRSTGPEGSDATPRQPVQTKSAQLAREQGKFRTSKGPRLQARSPIVKGGESAELIDFIRQGPTNDRGIGARLPRLGGNRNVDSDEPNARKDTHSVTSTNDSYQGRSVQSSTNSRTALIDPIRSNPPPAINRGPMRGPDPEAPAPGRKRYRNKDPYAIDISDDDEDMVETPIAKPRGRDESMMDFLNSEPPPASSQPQPLALSQATIDEQKARYNRRQALESPTGTNGNNGNSVGSRLGGKISEIAARASRPGTRQDKNPPPPPAKSGQGLRSPIYESMSTMPKKQMTAASMGRAPPRGGKGVMRAEGDTTVRDLAAFLNENEPPPGNNDRANTNGGFAPEEKSGFGRMFSRRTKNRT